MDLDCPTGYTAVGGAWHLDIGSHKLTVPDNYRLANGQWRLSFAADFEGTWVYPKVVCVT